MSLVFLTSSAPFTETDRLQLVLFGMLNRQTGPYVAAMSMHHRWSLHAFSSKQSQRLCLVACTIDRLGTLRSCTLHRIWECGAFSVHVNLLGRAGHAGALPTNLLEGAGSVWRCDVSASEESGALWSDVRSSNGLPLRGLVHAGGVMQVLLSRHSQWLSLHPPVSVTASARASTSA
jgi:hypothetical protein